METQSKPPGYALDLETTPPIGTADRLEFSPKQPMRFGQFMSSVVISSISWSNLSFSAK